MIIQIYAFTDPIQAQQAVEFGVDHIGFIAGDYGKVPGELRFQQARRLAQSLPSGVVRVALTMATEVDEIIRMASYVEPDIVHISTDPEEVGVSQMETLRKGLPGSIRLMKAIPVAGEVSINLAKEFAACSDLLLLDTKAPGLPGVGATGAVHDWNISRQIVQAVNILVILAGGLNAHNVSAAIRAVRPWGVDSNTGTNLQGDAVAKDMHRIQAFVEAVRKTESASEQELSG